MIKLEYSVEYVNFQILTSIVGAIMLYEYNYKSVRVFCIYVKVYSYSDVCTYVRA